MVVTAHTSPINLPCHLTYIQEKNDSRGHVYYLSSLDIDVVKWLEKENIDFNYSNIFTSIYFKNEEDKVRFILKWV